MGRRSSLVQEHVETFVDHCEAAAGTPLPRFTRDKFDAFVDWGILADGLLGLHFADSGDDNLVAFTCERRDCCPSCGAWRKVHSASHWVEHVNSRVPVP